MNTLHLTNLQLSVLCIPKQSDKTQQVKQIRTVITESIYFYSWFEVN